jgi:hypothetical protein
VNQLGDTRDDIFSKHPQSHLNHGTPSQLVTIHHRSCTSQLTT